MSRSHTTPPYPPMPMYPQHRRPTYRQPLAFALLAGLLLFAAGICVINSVLQSLSARREMPVSAPVEEEERILLGGPYSLTGQPTISVEFINQVLEYYQSPASNKGQALYNYGIEHQIDPAYALAFFMQESSFGTRGVATVTKSLGNIRTTPGYTDYQGYRQYTSWEEGFKDWYLLIADLYIQEWQLLTVDQIIPVYAPATDNNNEEQYIHMVKLAVSKWRSGIIEV